MNHCCIHKNSDAQSEADSDVQSEAGAERELSTRTHTNLRILEYTFEYWYFEQSRQQKANGRIEALTSRQEKGSRPEG